MTKRRNLFKSTISHIYMKSDKIILWVAKLYSSPFNTDPLNLKIFSSSATISDIESYLGTGSNNRIFRKWFKDAFEFGLFKCVGEIRKGKRGNVVSNGYIFVGSKSLVYLRKNSISKNDFKKVYTLCNRDRVL